MAQQLTALVALAKDPSSGPQHPLGSSQEAATPVPGDLTPSCIQQNTNAHEIKITFKNGKKDRHMAG
ncbi:hypothetical protein ACQP3C_25195 [Escherichia coli]